MIKKTIDNIPKTPTSLFFIISSILSLFLLPENIPSNVSARPSRWAAPVRDTSRVKINITDTRAGRKRFRTKNEKEIKIPNKNPIRGKYRSEPLTSFSSIAIVAGILSTVKKPNAFIILLPNYFPVLYYFNLCFIPAIKKYASADTFAIFLFIIPIRSLNILPSGKAGTTPKPISLEIIIIFKSVFDIL